MTTWVRYLVMLVVCLFVNVLSAHESESVFQEAICEIAQAKDQKGADVKLLQHIFDDRASDLAMILPGGEIKRVTFGGVKDITKCRYRAMMLSRGGDWGWHLAWIADDDNVLKYARMDGVAWVSSPTKKLSKNVKTASQPVILTFEQNVWITWEEIDSGVHQIYAVHSDDEGRSWNAVQLLKETAVKISQLRLIIRSGKPYLQFNDNVESEPLLQ